MGADSKLSYTNKSMRSIANMEQTAETYYAPDTTKASSLVTSTAINVVTSGCWPCCSFPFSFFSSSTTPALPDRKRSDLRKIRPVSAVRVDCAVVIAANLYSQYYFSTTNFDDVQRKVSLTKMEMVTQLREAYQFFRTSKSRS